MVLTDSTMLPLGTALPSFRLQDAVSGAAVSSDSVRGEHGTLVMFVCNHCPYVKHVMGEIGSVASEYAARGIGVVAINSNDVEAYPDDAPPRMRELAEREGWGFPYVLDDTQEVARAFHAACTPEFYLFDAGDRLVYRGRLDAARPGNDAPVDGRELRVALDALLAGDPPLPTQLPSAGCNIKWRPGNAPEYSG